MKPYLKPLSYLYERVVSIKNSMYDRGMIGAYKAPVKVISIGNLTVGGTGKTPITDFCLKALVRDGKRVAVVSRSYRADASASVRVDVTHPHAARYYGDEPVLLAQANPEVTVFVGDSKWRTAEYSTRNHGPFDVIVVDDGFQHRKLHRDFNIVILDATEPWANYQVVPEGRGRESWDGLQRADLILFTKCNLADEQSLKQVQSHLPPGKEVLYFGYDIVDIHNGELTLPTETLRGKKLFLVSAIARPDVFEKMMRTYGEISKKSLHYRDHHQYSNEDAQKIAAEFGKSGCDYLVTTSKDAVKLRRLLQDPKLLWSTNLQVEEFGDKGRLHEIIGQLFS
ncbi:tetraacyldisaccharide 4'-kinase [Bdellovibrio sp. KM01]|uniref:tetraacyldisaccharide 4'-kinase n=1 Tax=Bdellovibrio sp. KM01 TaxID=2748865 RepID=UPI0015E9D5FC|nr:tetraacyldisaccharide 4'-kinase [Bdellovibrio sp. KM01]QLY26806.1 tetraacyldisaccharide 4'-kinase [Bdellovibrio sp. KM01]